MTKGYWIAQVDVHDPEAYQAYVTANAAAFAAYGARFLVRGGTSDTVEGHFRSRIVVIEFPDYPTALACYGSEVYRAAMAIRTRHSTGDVIIVEGYDGLQPTEVAP